MAIGTTAAILGSAAIGAGASLASSNAQRRAANSAANTAADTADRQSQVALDIFNRQVELNEPFRQADIQRQNMLLEMFGGDPVGQPQAASANTGNALAQYGQNRPDYASYVNDSAGLANALRTLSAPNQRHIAQQGFDRTAGDNFVGTSALTGNALAKQPVQDAITTSSGAANDTGGLAPTVDPSVNGAERFNNSLFNAAFTNDFNRDRDRIDNALASSGLQFSGARMNAVENSRAQNFGNALSNYTNLMAGFPTTSPSTNAMTTAAGQYGANVSNALGNAGNAAMQSAYARGNANASMWDGLGSAAGFGLGAFSLGGRK